MNTTHLPPYATHKANVIEMMAANILETSAPFNAETARYTVIRHGRCISLPVAELTRDELDFVDVISLYAEALTSDPAGMLEAAEHTLHLGPILPEVLRQVASSLYAEVVH